MALWRKTSRYYADEYELHGLRTALSNALDATGEPEYMGALVLVDTSSASVRRHFAAQAAADAEELKRFFLKTGIDTLPIDTSRPYIDGVRELFRRRARKR